LTNLQNSVKQFWVLFGFIQFKYDMLKSILMKFQIKRLFLWQVSITPDVQYEFYSF
jgi:hypothetical protein